MIALIVRDDTGVVENTIVIRDLGDVVVGGRTVHPHPSVASADGHVVHHHPVVLGETRYERGRLVHPDGTEVQPHDWCVRLVRERDVETGAPAPSAPTGGVGG